jgi:hypothetical protein
VDDLRSARRVTAEDLRQLPVHERILNVVFYWIRAQL